METGGNTILITGGSTGIGLAMAERFVGLGNRVVICGRTQEKLDEARRKVPGLNAIRGDISKEAGRRELVERMGSDFGEVNMLVNNAGIQKRVDLRKGMEDLLKGGDEIEINLRSQIYLSALFIPLLSGKRNAAIINVSSGLGFVPLAIFPVYSATKAAMHSFSMSMRHQLKGEGIRVFELIPPTVHDTRLKGAPIGKTDYSLSAEEVVDALMEGLRSDKYEITAGASGRLASASGSEAERIFGEMNH